MSKVTGVLAISLLLCFCAEAQISKGNYLIGGSGTFVQHTNRTDGVVRSRDSRLNITGNVGYFPFSRFAAGLTINYERTHQKVYNYNNGGSTNFGNNVFFGGGPFVRYYFLKPAARVNLFAGASIAWQYSNFNNGNNYGPKLYMYDYTFFAGPAIFINKNIALEIMAGYADRRWAHYDQSFSGVDGKLGFQWHFRR